LSISTANACDAGTASAADQAIVHATVPTPPAVPEFVHAVVPDAAVAPSMNKAACFVAGETNAGARLPLASVAVEEPMANVPLTC
jgi:hypothetical protein